MGANCWSDEGATVASDERYFALGADRLAIGPCRLYLAPGFEDVAAGAVAVAIGAADPVLDSARAIDELADRAHRRGCPQLRVYLDVDDLSGLGAALAHRGAVGRREVALAAPAGALDPPVPGLALVPVVDDHGWAAKEALHLTETRSPDGHAVDPRRWVAFERMKATAGPFAPQLVYLDGVPIGTVAVMRLPDVTRFKNLVLAPAWRGRGLAGEVVRAMGQRFPDRPVGGVAGDGSIGDRRYRAIGMGPVGRMAEWTLPLP